MVVQKETIWHAKLKVGLFEVNQFDNEPVVHFTLPEYELKAI